MATTPEALTHSQTTAPVLEYMVLRSRTFAIAEHVTPRETVNHITPKLILPKQSTAAHVHRTGNPRTFLLRENPRLIRHADPFRHFRHTESTTARVHRGGHPHAFVLHESTSAHVNAPGSKTKRFTVHQHTDLDFTITNVDKKINVRELGRAKKAASQIAPPFVIAEHTHVKHKTTPDIKPHLEQITEIIRHGDQHRKFKVQEHVHPVHRSTPDKPFKLHQHTNLKRLKNHTSVTHRIALTTHVHERTNLHVRRVVSVTPGIKHVSTPVKRLHDQIHPSVELSTPALHIYHSVKAKTHVHAYSDTRRAPFHFDQPTQVTRTAEVGGHLAVSQATTITQPRKALRYTIKVVETPLITVTTDITRNDVPVMGSIWQAIDVAGTQVPTISDLHDYYFYFNTDDIPSLSWDFSDLQRDSTNDSYKFWKTK